MIRFLLGLAVLAAPLSAASAQEQTCTNSGNIYQVGDVACISACHSEQTRLARCEAKSYGTTWTYLSESCPSAGLPGAPRVATWLQQLDHAQMTPIPLAPRSVPTRG